MDFDQILKWIYLTGTITPGQGKPESNGNEGVTYNPQIYKTGVSPIDAKRDVFLTQSNHILN